MPDGSFIENMDDFQFKNETPPDVHIVFPAEESAVRRALQTICATLKSLSLKQDSLALVEVILAEVTNNIVEHAYANTCAGTIQLSCKKTEGTLRFEVIDQGEMFPGGELPPKRHHDLASGIAELPEGGFGWGLIRDLTSDLAYRRSNERNILSFSVICA